MAYGEKFINDLTFVDDIDGEIGFMFAYNVINNPLPFSYTNTNSNRLRWRTSSCW